VLTADVEADHVLYRRACSVSDWDIDLLAAKLSHVRWGGLSLCGLLCKFLLIYYHFFPITNIWAQLCNTLHLHGNFQLVAFQVTVSRKNVSSPNHPISQSISTVNGFELFLLKAISITITIHHNGDEYSKWNTDQCW